mmetsp:Transcript_159793/g.512775  ORF Transcript_159793/g.512775 Transcript_159793/m.512775 type:complete len:241 (-) Transcript_159793:3094-3816(-)
MPLASSNCCFTLVSNSNSTSVSCKSGKPTSFVRLKAKRNLSGSLKSSASSSSCFALVKHPSNSMASRSGFSSVNSMPSASFVTCVKFPIWRKEMASMSRAWTWSAHCCLATDFVTKTSLHSDQPPEFLARILRECVPAGSAVCIWTKGQCTSEGWPSKTGSRESVCKLKDFVSLDLLVKATVTSISMRVALDKKKVITTPLCCFTRQSVILGTCGSVKNVNGFAGAPEPIEFTAQRPRNE